MTQSSNLAAPVTLGFLRYGATLFPQPLKKEQESSLYPVARGLWSCGLVVVAPAGALSHVARAAWYALGGLSESTPDATKELHERSIQHLNCAGADALATLAMFIIGPAALATLLAYAILGGTVLSVGALLVLLANIICTLGMLSNDESPLHLSLCYVFAINPQGPIEGFSQQPSVSSTTGATA